MTSTDVVRDYLAGTTSTSILQMYKKGSREMYGHRFPEGLRDNQKLPQTIITPTTKAEQGEHDAPLSADDILSRTVPRPPAYHSVRSSRANRRCQQAHRGIGTQCCALRVADED